MGLISDVTDLEIEGEDTISIAAAVSSITIEDAFAVPDITITPFAGPEILEVQVAGPQGPPGLQNVYIQSNDPAVEFGWGAEEAGFVWIQI